MEAGIVVLLETLLRYTVRIDNRGTDGIINIGFTTGTNFKVNWDNMENGWFIRVQDGFLVSRGISFANYSSKINGGDYVTVIREGTAIRFEKNKIDLGVCTIFTGIPNEPLFPAIDMYNKASVTIVNNYYQVPLLFWDINNQTDYCTYTNDNLTVTKINSVASWNVCRVIGNIAVDRYTIRIDNQGTDGGIIIGFANETNFVNGNNRRNCWCIRVGSGISVPFGMLASFSDNVTDGDYFTVIRDGTTLRFEQNKIDLGVRSSFFGIPNKPLFPAIDMYSRYASVTLVNDY